MALGFTLPVARRFRLVFKVRLAPRMLMMGFKFSLGFANLHNGIQAFIGSHMLIGVQVLHGLAHFNNGFQLAYGSHAIIGFHIFRGSRLALVEWGSDKYWLAF